MKSNSSRQEISQSYLLRDYEVNRDEEIGNNITTPLSHPKNPSNPDF